jgi:hypothetical protein
MSQQISVDLMAYISTYYGRDQLGGEISDADAVRKFLKEAKSRPRLKISSFYIPQLLHVTTTEVGTTILLEPVDHGKYKEIHLTSGGFALFFETEIG